MALCLCTGACSALALEARVAAGGRGWGWVGGGGAHAKLHGGACDHPTPIPLARTGSQGWPPGPWPHSAAPQSL